MVELPTEDEPVKVVCGDCADVLPQLGLGCVDVVVTSPPYNQLHGSGINGGGMMRRNGFTNTAKRIGYADDMPELDYQGWLRGIVEECVRVSAGLVWVNHKTRYRDGRAIHPLHFLPFPVYSEVIWDRGGSMALNCKRFAPSHEVVYGFGSPHYWSDGGNALMSVWRISATREVGGRGHPCPFPTIIPRRLISSSCPPGGIVLDPFGGSGTTAVAALKEGRRCLIVEREPAYCEIIRCRVAEAMGVGKGSLLAPVQGDLFADAG